MSPLPAWEECSNGRVRNQLLIAHSSGPLKLKGKVENSDHSSERKAEAGGRV